MHRHTLAIAFRAVGLLRVPLLLTAGLCLLFSADQASEVANSAMATSEPTALVAAWIAASLFAISLCSVGVSLLRTASATNVLPAPTSVAYALLLLIAISLLGLHGIVWTRYAGT